MSRARRWQLLLHGLGSLAVMVVLGWLFHNTLDKAWIDASVRGRGLHGELVYLVTGGLAVAGGVSRQLISFLGGYAFGLVSGFLLAMAASVLGCVLAFFVARLLGRGWVVRHYGHRVRRVDAFLHENPFTMTLLVRLLPVGSNLVVNLAAGVSRIRFWPFVVGSALGYVPQTLVFVLIGSGITVEPVVRIGLGVVLFVVSGMLGFWLYRRYRHGRSLDRALDAALDEDPGAAG
ncbi:MAG: TVP38/TMEM64 family protein [Gammaproteobacteria bacterium]|nr:MAG: TVP38/TMEM64 family protein [Gammaproteobacteria bacterium]